MRVTVVHSPSIVLLPSIDLFPIRYPIPTEEVGNAPVTSGIYGSRVRGRVRNKVFAKKKKNRVRMLLRTRIRVTRTRLKLCNNDKCRYAAGPVQLPVSRTGSPLNIYLSGRDAVTSPRVLLLVHTSKKKSKMPPQEKVSGVLIASDAHDAGADALPPASPGADDRPLRIVWRNVILFLLLHLGGVYGGYLFLTKAMWRTCLFAVVLYVCSGLGITAGAHRLWAHKSYRAKLPLRILLTVFNTIAFQRASWHRPPPTFSIVSCHVPPFSSGVLLSVFGHPPTSSVGVLCYVCHLWGNLRQSYSISPVDIGSCVQSISNFVGNPENIEQEIVHNAIRNNPHAPTTMHSNAMCIRVHCSWGMHAYVHANSDSVIDWARDHRMHHKYSETDADPHNATRGFFFSHIGWLLVKKHPQIKAKGHTIDMNDLWADPVLRFQKKYYLLLMPIVCFILPTWIPTLWGESLWNAYFVCAIFRYTYVLNVTWLVNSAAHKWGDKPYDKNINPVETRPVSLVVLGEGFHNYHHTFPWDYKTAELGHYTLNISKLFIDIMSMIGWAYDLKTVSSKVIEQRVKRTGDGSHPVWGWDDNDVPQEDKKGTITINPAKTK
ncbi:Acyl-CoA Delta(11) desaturase [Eumeta japonica]|uniref:Acyl-CoA Delta(11) desaturase n=1 Tax=Eumeta variegata TaxID=151549 RepID=A0A4C1UA19_EUMVA|nr:Acyl-CoA Delta(11) desaturase [Eumeta japonica]